MSQLQQIFEIAAGADADAVLSTPNLSYVVELLRRSGETLCAGDLEQLYADEGWLPGGWRCKLSGTESRLQHWFQQWGLRRMTNQTTHLTI